MVKKPLTFVGDQIKGHTYLGKDGKCVTTSEYPEFAWKEIIVNAVAHRDYSIKGTNIQIKMFDDWIAVESLGDLPGIVRLDNMRKVHFSRRSPHFCMSMTMCRNLAKGYMEMEKAGLPAPEYRYNAFMLNATIRNGINVADNVVDTKRFSATEQAILDHLKILPELSAKELVALLHKTARTVQRNMNSLKEKGVLRREGTDRKGRWVVLK